MHSLLDGLEYKCKYTIILYSDPAQLSRFGRELFKNMKGEVEREEPILI